MILFGRASIAVFPSAVTNLVDRMNEVSLVVEESRFVHFQICLQTRKGRVNGLLKFDETLGQSLLSTNTQSLL